MSWLVENRMDIMPRCSGAFNGPNPASCLFSSFSQHNDKYSTKYDYKWNKHGWCAWDSNPGPQTDPLSYGVVQVLKVLLIEMNLLL